MVTTAMKALSVCGLAPRHALRVCPTRGHFRLSRVTVVPALTFGEDPTLGCYPGTGGPARLRRLDERAKYNPFARIATGDSRRGGPRGANRTASAARPSPGRLIPRGRHQG